MKKFLALLWLVNLAVPALAKDGRPDLIITKIATPVWDNEARQSLIAVTIKNVGPAFSPGVRLSVKDYDPAKATAVPPGLTAEERAIFDEQRRPDYLGDDRNWEVSTETVGIGPGQSQVVEVKVSDFWVFDNDCELEAEVNDNHRVEESDFTNNRRWFLKRG